MANHHIALRQTVFTTIIVTQLLLRDLVLAEGSTRFFPRRGGHPGQKSGPIKLSRLPGSWQP